MSDLERIPELLGTLRNCDPLEGDLQKAGFAPRASSVPGVRTDLKFRELDASLYLPGGPLEVYLEVLQDKEPLFEDEAAYERMLQRYHELYAEACRLVVAELGPPAFEGGPDDPGYSDDWLGLRVSRWELGPASLRVEIRDDGPEVPSWLGLVLQP
ncbi:MAG: hypothetical protein AB1758_03460 [Candidatus Eremiobacterota bacterium]